MLDFKTCQRCCKQHGLHFSDSVKGWADLPNFYCPTKYVDPLDDFGPISNEGYMKSDGPTPRWCPNILEHIILEIGNAK